MDMQSWCKLVLSTLPVMSLWIMSMSGRSGAEFEVLQKLIGLVESSHNSCGENPISYSQIL